MLAFVGARVFSPLLPFTFQLNWQYGIDNSIKCYVFVSVECFTSISFRSLYSLISYHEFPIPFLFTQLAFLFIAPKEKRSRFFMVCLALLSQISMLVNRTSSLFFALHISAASKPEALLSLLDSERNQCFILSYCLCVCARVHVM